MKNIGFSSVNITGGFWKEKQDMVKNVTVNAVYDRFEETHRFEALKCKPQEYTPHIFWDSDVAKWIESAAYILKKEKRDDLVEKVEAAIDDIISNADENGYFNSHFLVADQDKRFTLRDRHELYCAGHLIEAAIAYYDATGKDRFLKAMCKYADYIERVFKIEKSAHYITPGHPEIELALVKLYHATGEKRYLSLAEYFVDEHGKDPTEGEYVPTATSKYNQDDSLIKDRTTIDGHCVRAFYLFSAVADIAYLRNDKELSDACKRVFDNFVNKRMYITGASGSTHMGEAFTADYHLPNRLAYAETCASYALALFGKRMFKLDHSSKYADAVERVLYNGFLSGVSMDGRSFFYDNPLEKDPDFDNVYAATKRSERFGAPVRKEVFSCSCCPPNITRLISTIGNYLYSYDEETLYVHHYVNSVTECDAMVIEQTTDYPASGNIKLKVNTNGRKLALRVPGWCRKFAIDADYVLENGYAIISADREEVDVAFDMPVTPVRANRRVHDNAGRIAIMRGPVVYCAEGVDNGKDIRNIRVDLRGEFKLCDSEFLLPAIQATAYQLPESDALYFAAEDDWTEMPLTLIPFYAHANRGATEMNVWLLEK